MADMPKTEKIIGIDLGTTNSCVAVMEGDKAKVIEQRRGRSHHPIHRRLPAATASASSARSAKRQAVTNPTNTLFSIKRLIGRRFTGRGRSTKDKDMVPYKIVGGQRRAG
jgi:molecular chaperone DnaK